MLDYVVGDLLCAKEEIIAHGCNTLGKFGAGVAGQIAQRWPKAKEHYLEKYRAGGWNLGDVQLVSCDTKLIANLAVQATVGRTGKHIDYDALRTAFRRLIREAYIMNLKVAMPRIGVGLGGGRWGFIEEILNKELHGFDVIVRVYSKE